MDNFFSRRGLPSKWDVIIEGLLVNNKSNFFTALYQAMMEYPGYIILSDMAQDKKIEILTSMLAHYEEREDYEKCANLVKLKENLKNSLC